MVLAKHRTKDRTNTTLAVIFLLTAFLLTACNHSSSSGETEAVDQAPITDTAAQPGSPATIHCGVVRWAVKTGADADANFVNLTPKPTTVAGPSGLLTTQSPFPVNAKFPNFKRAPQEQQTYTIHAVITSYAAEQDSDLHLVIIDAPTTPGSSTSKKTMIAEIPNPSCMANTPGANPPITNPFKALTTAARAAFLAKTGFKPPVIKPGQYKPSFVKTSLPATLTGVAFYDDVHGQAGVAPNGVELHPVLSITFP